MKTKRLLISVCAALLALTAAAQPQPPATPPRYVEGELLVKFAGGPRGAQAEQARGRMRHEVKRHFDFIGWQHVRLPRGMTVEEGLERYRNQPGVLAVEPNGLAHPRPMAPTNLTAGARNMHLVPDDPQFNQQWSLAKIDATNAWALTTGSADVVAVVTDTGVNYNHEDLAANLWRNPGEIPANSLDDDGNGFVDDVHGIDAVSDDTDPLDEGLSSQYHGTACAGIIGAVGNNGKGLAGANWTVRIMALRIIPTASGITLADRLQAFNYMLLMKSRGVNIRVSSMSWGASAFHQAEFDALSAIGNAGILQFAATLNTDTDVDVTPDYPGNHQLPSIIAVANSDVSDLLRSSVHSSGYGRTNVDLAAPGTVVPVLWGPGNSNYANVTGTSFATPLVAGAAALLFAVNPSATAEDVKAALLETVDVLPAFTNKMVSNGRLNVGRAMLHPRIATGPPILVAQPQHKTAVLSNSVAFSVGSGGTRPLNYQWLFNGVEVAATTNAALELTSVSFTDGGAYSVVVSNSFGSVTSQIATLTVIPLLITSHPRGQNIRLTSNVTFTVSVSSPVPVNYRWRFNGTNPVGADSGTLVLSGVQLSNEGNYSVEVSNAFGSAVSSNAALVVLIDPVITFAPVNQSVVAGGSATLSVAFTGHPMPFGVEWRQGSVPQASNTVSRFQDFYTLTNAQPSQAGQWRVIVRNLARNTATGENRTFNLTVLPDGDGNGLPDDWETTYPTAANGVDDTDEDGLTNLQEYRAGTDPTDALSYLRVDSIALAGESNLVSLRFLAAANKTYTVESRPAADAGAWTRLADVVAASSNRVVEVIDQSSHGTNAQRYYRLVTPRSP